MTPSFWARMATNATDDILGSVDSAMQDLFTGGTTAQPAPPVPRAQPRPQPNARPSTPSAASGAGPCAAAASQERDAAPRAVRTGTSAARELPRAGVSAEGLASALNAAADAARAEAPAINLGSAGAAERGRALGNIVPGPRRMAPVGRVPLSAPPTPSEEARASDEAAPVSVPALEESTAALERVDLTGVWSKVPEMSNDEAYEVWRKGLELALVNILLFSTLCHITHHGHTHAHTHSASHLSLRTLCCLARQHHGSLIAGMPRPLGDQRHAESHGQAN